MLLRKSYRGLPPEGSTVRERTAAIEGLPGPPHIPPALALGITEEWKVRVPPSWRAAPRPPVSRTWAVSDCTASGWGGEKS